MHNVLIVGTLLVGLTGAAHAQGDPFSSRGSIYHPSSGDPSANPYAANPATTTSAAPGRSQTKPNSTQSNNAGKKDNLKPDTGQADRRTRD